MAGGAITAARALVEEHRRGATFRPFAATFGIACVADAYAVQREYVRLEMRERGTGVAGYKVGLTARRMQQMCGIDSPIAGVVLRDRVYASGVHLNAAAYGRVGLEFEIAVRLGRDLALDGDAPARAPAAPAVIAAVAEAVDAVCPAIEIIDDRRADYAGLEILSLIADNAWNAGIVLGPFARIWPDLAALAGTIAADGTIIDRGSGRDVLGHPLQSVAWLAGHLAETGTTLRAGDVVMTGNLATTKFPERRSDYRFDLLGLGAVEVSIEA